LESIALYNIIKHYVMTLDIRINKVDNLVQTENLSHTFTSKICEQKM